MDGPMSISSMLSEPEAAPLSLEECTIKLPGPTTPDRDAYQAARLARFRALEQWEEGRAEEAMAQWALEYADKWARKARVYEAQVYPALEPRAVSRVVREEKQPATLKRKIEETEPTKAKFAKITPPPKNRLGPEKLYKSVFDGIWREMARKEVPKVYKIYQAATTVKQSNERKTSVLASKEARKWQYRTNKHVKEMQSKARKAMKEMMAHWKKSEKEERSQRRSAERAKLETAKREEEEREAARQARKLNFLITQTELYSHFVGSKASEASDDDASDGASATAGAGATDSIKTENAAPAAAENGSDPNVPGTPATASGLATSSSGRTAYSALDLDDEEALAAAAKANAQRAVKEARQRASQFDAVPATAEGTTGAGTGAGAGAGADATSRGTGSAGTTGAMNFQNPSSLGETTIPQPSLLNCQLKEYQIKGLTWLANLYEQGINGILADEMGLGKTVQSISVMAYLAEVHNIWGPFLVIAPASTLHNWQQEITKFVPDFKVLPYWGTGKDRKVLRKFWDRKQLRYTRDSPFHVLVTSYQLIVADSQYFNRVKWQYMILDEAQAIKSSTSSRWKSLLSMQCRNRLLLTGTPIQNSMQELWALLHFIMPTLFDSHEEFSDWFSKDIESHATKNSDLNEQQLQRLHMILKPFMLRRVKKDVQRELGEKIEKDIMCSLTNRQKAMYRSLQSQISLKDLEGEDSASLMNLVMQFRKVCNHPDLFERADVKSPFSFGSFGRSPPPHLVATLPNTPYSCDYSLRNDIEFKVPKLVYREKLDVPHEGSDAFIRRKVERMVTVWEPRSEVLGAIAHIAGASPTELITTSRKGLFERALDLYELDKAPAHPDIDVDPYLAALEGTYHDPASAPPIAFVGSDRSLLLDQQRALFPESRRSLLRMSLDQEWACALRGHFPPSNLYPDGGKSGYSNITMPSMRRFIMESGKLSRLDSLLAQLKAEGHRVLIYFQMTRMMDLMGEYLTYRQYKFLRLDGSSKLGDRRDDVDAWQTNPDNFVFLLSTRAGGLGINLTAADTVIFYDSDWNPTIDSQAMDRAHRLGQTRQVTVYRLLVKGTIEERMRDRAKQKEHVQHVVMEGGKSAEFQKPGGKEVASWLMEDAAE